MKTTLRALGLGIMLAFGSQAYAYGLADLATVVSGQDTGTETSPGTPQPGVFPFGGHGQGGQNPVCIQVIVAAKDPSTGTCQEFATPCEIPQGWRPVGNSCNEKVQAPVDFGNQCPKGGSRTVTGGLNKDTGELAVTVTLDKCVFPNGVIADGSSSMTGNIDAATGAFDVTEAVNITYTTPAKNKTPELTSTRNCEIQRKGTYDEATKIFTGSVTRNNCVFEGQFYDRRGLVDHLLKNQSTDEEDVSNGGTETGSSAGTE